MRQKPPMALAFLAASLGAGLLWITLSAPSPQRHTGPDLHPHRSPKTEMRLLEETLWREGAESAWHFLKSRHTSSAGFTGGPNNIHVLEAHQLAHLVGASLYREAGLEGMRVCEPILSYGCHHGLLRAALAQKGPAILIEARDACYTYPGTIPLAAGCIHGIGHGLALYENLDTLQAIEECNRIGHYAEFCWEGVFMEFMTSAPVSAYRRDEPWYPCTAVPEVYRPRCARVQVQAMRMKLGLTVPEIAEICMQANDQEMEYHCLDGIGFFAARTAAGDSAEVKRICSTVKKHNSYEHCLMAASREIVYQTFPEWQKTSSELCGMLSDPIGAHCEERIERTVAVYHAAYDKAYKIK